MGLARIPPAGTVTVGLWEAAQLSLLVASGATVLALGPGVALGFALARRRFPLQGLVEQAVLLPLVLPPVVTGYVLLLALPRTVAFTWVAAVLASAVVGLPLLVQTARVAFEAVGPELEDAARVDGAGRWAAWWRVTLPVAAPGVAAGTALHFARALGEFGATIIVAGNIPGRTQTLPLALYASLQQAGGTRQAVEIALVSVGLAVACLGAAGALTRRLRA